LHLGDGLLKKVNVREDLADQHEVVWLDTSDERLAQLRQLGAELSAGQVGQHLGVAFTLDQRRKHRSTAHSQNVSRNTGQLEVRTLERLLQPIGLVLAGLDQRLSVAR